MLDLTWLIIAGLATWRLCHLAIFETGPLAVFEHLRTAAVSSPFLSELISCIFCLSIWVGAAVWLVSLTPARVLLIPLALSALAVMVEGYVSADR